MTAPRLLVLGLLVGVALGALSCGHPPGAVKVSPHRTLRHNISLWPDDDQVCIELPTEQQVYVQFRCTTMETLRSFLVTARSSN